MEKHCLNIQLLSFLIFCFQKFKTLQLHKAIIASLTKVISINFVTTMEKNMDLLHQGETDSLPNHNSRLFSWLF